MNADAPSVPSPGPTPAFHVHHWSSGARMAASALQLLALGHLLWMAANLVRAYDAGLKVHMGPLGAWLVLLTLLPAGLAVLLRAGCAARVEVHADRLLLQLRGA